MNTYCFLTQLPRSMYARFAFWAKSPSEWLPILTVVFQTAGLKAVKAGDCCESRGLLSLAPGRHHGDRCHACFCQCTLILTCSIPAIPVLGPSCAKFYSLFVYSYKQCLQWGGSYCEHLLCIFSFHLLLCWLDLSPPWCLLWREGPRLEAGCLALH